MKVTDNLNLNLPDFSNNANIEDLNKNSIIIDDEVNKLKIKLSNLEITGATKEEIERLKKSIADLENAQFTINNNINTLSKNKVDKISGKGLSTNDFTNAHKRKVDVELPDAISKAGKVDMVNNIKPDENKNVSITGSDIPYNSDSDETILNKIDILNKEKADNKDLSRSSTIVIANYDSHENSKKAADIVIEEGENAAVKINQAIQSLEGFGGEIKLMEGNYNLEYGLAVNVDGVHLTGIPGATVLLQNSNWKGNPNLNDRKYIIDTWRINNSNNVAVKVSSLRIECDKDIHNDSIEAYGFSKFDYVTVNNSGNIAFSARDNSVITNSESISSRQQGFYSRNDSKVMYCISYQGTIAVTGESFATFNTIIGETITSVGNATAEYNIVKEG